MSNIPAQIAKLASELLVLATEREAALTKEFWDANEAGDRPKVIISEMRSDLSAAYRETRAARNLAVTLVKNRARFASPEALAAFLSK